VQIKICLFILRRTYGWNSSDDAISIADIAKACNADRTHVTRQVNELIRKNIIRRLSGQPGKVSQYAIVTNIAAWDQNYIDLDALHNNSGQGIYANDKIRRQRLHGGAKVNKLPLPDRPEPYSYAKSISGILSGTIYFFESHQYQLSELLLNKILAHTPAFKKPDLQKWAQQMNVIMEIDQRPPEEVKAVILFAQDDSFWRDKILSVSKLRKQYDQLNARRLLAHASPAARKYQSTNSNEEEADDYKWFYK
jgi:phage replication O-like protein O